MANKRELANLAVKLFDNIDQADQFDVCSLFAHLDNAFLLCLIDEMLDTIENNKGKNVIVSEDELRAVVVKARRILGRTDSCYLLEDSGNSDV